MQARHVGVLQGAILGYIAGGTASATNAIEKFSLSSDGNSAVVANLAYGTESGAAGTEY